jgi:hypothetical protein
MGFTKYLELIFGKGEGDEFTSIKLKNVSKTYISPFTRSFVNILFGEWLPTLSFLCHAGFQCRGQDIEYRKIFPAILVDPSKKSAKNRQFAAGVSAENLFNFVKVG